MFNKPMIRLLVYFSVLSLVMALSCSDNSTNPNGNPDVTLSDYTDVIEQIAPPLFGGTGLAKPAVMDSIWMYGDYPLLGKVFGADEPMSLYRNVESLDQQIAFINDIIAATNDTITENVEDTTYHAAVSLEELTDPVEIPEQAQAILGSDPLDLEYHVSLQIVELPEMVLEAAFTADSTEETVLCFQSQPTAMFDPEYPDGMESNLFWANRNLETDAIHIKCVFFKDYGDETSAIWGYEIQTVGESDFQYRMSWYSNEESVPEGFLGAIIGGGNKDELFALSYRAYHPVDSLYEEIGQLFGPDYSDEGDITTEYEDYVDSTLYIMYEELPTELLTNPLDAAELISPWGGH